MEQVVVELEGKMNKAIADLDNKCGRAVSENVPLVSSGRAEVEDEVPIGSPRSPELELPNAACPQRAMSLLQIPRVGNDSTCPT